MSEKKPAFRSCLLILAAAALAGFPACKTKSDEKPFPELRLSAETGVPVRRQDAFFGLHFDLHPQETDTSLGADVSADNIASLLDRVRPDYVQYDCKGHAGYAGYPTAVGWPSPVSIF